MSLASQGNAMAVYTQTTKQCEATLSFFTVLIHLCRRSATERRYQVHSLAVIGSFDSPEFWPIYAF